jgi:prophage DNA circulation protein
VTDFLPPVVAALRGDISDYLAKLAAADEAMKKFGKSIPDGLSKQKETIGREGGKAGEQYGGKFSESVSKKITAAYKALPDLKITADSSEADRKLFEVRAEMEALSKKRINIDIDESAALARLRTLQTELEKLKTSASGVGRGADITSALKDLDSAGKMFATEAGNVGRSLGQRLGQQMGLSAEQGLGSVFEGGLMNPIVMAALAPAAVELGTGIGGLMLTGIGLAGIGVGIAGQIHNWDVGMAGRILGQKVSTGFKQATSSFADPMVNALFTLGGEWDKLQLGMDSTFGYLAPEVTALTEGVVGFADKLVPAFERAAVASEPLVQTFAAWLPQIGGELGSLFDTLATHADTFNDALRLVLGTVDLLVKGVDVTTNSFAGLFKIAEMTTGTLDAVIGSVTDGGTATRFLSWSTTAAGGAAAAAGPDFDALSQTLNQTTLDADDLAGAMADKIVNAMLAADHATLGLAEAQTRLTETLGKNGHAFDIHKKSAQQNREAVLGVISANLAEYDSMIKSGFSAADAASAYDKNTASLEKQLKKAKFTSTEIDDLIGKYKHVPDNVNTDIQANGLTNAINNLGGLIAQLNGLDGSVFGFLIKSRTVYSSDYSSYRAGERGATGGLWSGPGKIRHFAQGGLATEPTIGFGEPQTGGEWLIPNRGISQARAAWLLGSAASAHGLSVGAPAATGGDGSSTPTYVPIVVTLGGTQMATVHAQLIPAAQQYKIRTGTTGLT